MLLRSVSHLIFAPKYRSYGSEERPYNTGGDPTTYTG